MVSAPILCSADPRIKPWPKDSYPDEGFLWFFLVSPGMCHDTSYYAKTASFQLISN